MSNIWIELENKHNLKPIEVANLAKVSPSMYYKVRSGSRTFQESTIFLLSLNLAKRENFQGRSAILNEAKAIIQKFRAENFLA